jgi:hypothetical protein
MIKKGNHDNIKQLTTIASVLVALFSRANRVCSCFEFEGDKFVCLVSRVVVACCTDCLLLRFDPDEYKLLSSDLFNSLFILNKLRFTFVDDDNELISLFNS